MEKPYCSLREMSWHMRDQLASQSNYSTGELDTIIFWLLEHHLSITHTDWLLNKSVIILPEIQTALETALGRLARGEPIQYILGECNFYGYKLIVTSEVLIPRRETEELVRMVIERERSPVRILDVGTGSGCIAITLAKEIKGADVWAIDSSNLALNVAAQNAQMHEAAITFEKVDILRDIHFAEPFDVVVSNPPYVRHDESSAMADRVLQYEPSAALFVENEQPLVFYERMAALAEEGKLLKEEGRVYWEINEAFGKETRQLLSQHKFSGIFVQKDMQGKDRFIVGLYQK